jgi:hypothetical protein
MAAGNCVKRAVKSCAKELGKASSLRNRAIPVQELLSCWLASRLKRERESTPTEQLHRSTDDRIASRDVGIPVYLRTCRNEQEKSP